MSTFQESNRLKRNSNQVHIVRPFVPYGTLLRSMGPGYKLYAVLIHTPETEPTEGYADIRLIRSERDYDRAISKAKKVTRVRHLEWHVQTPSQYRNLLNAELRALSGSVAADRADLNVVSRRAELEREIKRLDRHLAGKHPHPWWHWKRWLRPRG